MAERGWQPDPAGRYRLRWRSVFPRELWTDQVWNEVGATLTDPDPAVVAQFGLDHPMLEKYAFEFAR